MSFWCHRLDHNTNEIFSRISALASKKTSNQKVPLFFWFDLFLEARAEILWKNFVGFLGDLKTPKVHFKINWPLGFRLVMSAKSRFKSFATEVQRLTLPSSGATTTQSCQSLMFFRIHSQKRGSTWIKKNKIKSSFIISHQMRVRVNCKVRGGIFLAWIIKFQMSPESWFLARF